jgi:protoheme IX farnesyltransferase
VTPDEALDLRHCAAHRLVCHARAHVNWVAGALLAFTIAFYVLVYTDVAEAAHAAEHRHRRRGGRVPPLIGWAAATGSVGIESVVLFRSSSCGRRRTFWALALYRARDYGAPACRCCPWWRARRDAQADRDLRGAAGAASA